MIDAYKNQELLAFAEATLLHAKRLSGHASRTKHIRQQLKQAIERLQKFELCCRKRPELAEVARDFLPTLKTELALLKKENAPARAFHKRIKGDFTYGR